MSITRDLFNERRAEIEAYFDFLADIIDHRASLLFPVPRGGNEDDRVEKPVHIDLSHTLKANGFLLLYNLVEASIGSAIEEIHATIAADAGLGADALIDPLTSNALGRFRAGAMTITQHCMHPVSQTVLRYWLDDHQRSIANNKNPLFSGNIDAKKVREVAEDYGFSHRTSRAAKGGKRLLDVKSKRNALAHGKVAFKACGQSLAMPELQEIKTEVIRYLDEILANIETYLSAQTYLRVAPIPAPPPTVTELLTL